jgi:hypothetical protein
MDLPPLYKYLDIAGAEKTLVNRTFKYAKPSDFYLNNDKTDMTIEQLFPVNELEVLQIINQNLIDVLIKNLNRDPTSLNPQLSFIHQAFRNDPEIAKRIKEKVSRDSILDIWDVDKYTKFCRETVSWINDFLQGYRVLCVSDSVNSLKMWNLYSQNGEGISLRITPSSDLKKDSAFKLFRKVEYAAVRPPLFNDVLSFIEESLFGDLRKREKRILENIIYTKTKEWEHEREYRLVIPMHENTLPYHSE